jgi:hypothetical protein
VSVYVALARGVTLPELADQLGFRTLAARQVEGDRASQRGLAAVCGLLN